jgi:hypothetical protein
MIPKSKAKEMLIEMLLRREDGECIDFVMLIDQIYDSFKELDCEERDWRKIIEKISSDSKAEYPLYDVIAYLIKQLEVAMKANKDFIKKSTEWRYMKVR